MQEVRPLHQLGVDTFAWVETASFPSSAAFRRFGALELARGDEWVLRMTRAKVEWEAVGKAIGGYDAAVRYTKPRAQFDKPIAAHQFVQDLLVKSLSTITASLGMVVRASQMFDAGTQRDEKSAPPTAYAASRIGETAAWCRAAQSGNGIVPGYAVAIRFADARAICRYKGTRNEHPHGRPRRHRPRRLRLADAPLCPLAPPPLARARCPYLRKICWSARRSLDNYW